MGERAIASKPRELGKAYEDGVIAETLVDAATVQAIHEVYEASTA